MVEVLPRPLRAGIPQRRCGGFAFFDAAKLLPGYDKYLYECAVRALTVYEPRERGDYRLHPAARKILRVVLGPAPGDPEYAAWWRARLVSVAQMKRDGQTVEFAETPPVPLSDEKPEEPKKAPKRKTAKKKG